MRADIVAEDRTGTPVLDVQVTSRPQTVDALLQLSELMVESGLPFAMLVDPKSIRFGRWDGDQLEELVTLDSRQVFTTYDENFGDKRIFEPYLISLVEAWLRDLAYNWKSAAPPGSDELKPTGLLDRLEGGTTKREVNVRGASVR